MYLVFFFMVPGVFLLQMWTFSWFFIYTLLREEKVWEIWVILDGELHVLLASELFCFYVCIHLICGVLYHVPGSASPVLLPRVGISVIPSKMEFTRERSPLEPLSCLFLCDNPVRASSTKTQRNLLSCHLPTWQAIPPEVSTPLLKWLHLSLSWRHSSSLSCWRPVHFLSLILTLSYPVFRGK